MTPRHRERLRALAPFAIPEPDSPNRAAFEEALDRAVPSEVARKFARNQWKKTAALTGAQATNGAGLTADETLREFLGEYNGRVIRYGLSSLPSSFNGFEAFLTYQPPLICFRLLPERDQQFSWSHFMDYVTSEAPELDVAEALEAMPEGTILHYSNVDDPGDLMFSGSAGRNFGTQAFSMVRHGSEVTVVFTGGEEADLAAESKDLGERMWGGKLYRRYLEKRDGPTEAVPIESSTELWRVLAVSRLDLDLETESARYVIHDVGDSYRIRTDDLAVYTDARGEFLDQGAQRVAEGAPEALAAYSALFDLSATALHLPGYFDRYADAVEVKRTETAYRAEILKGSAHSLKRWIPASERIAFRSVERLVPHQPPLKVGSREFAPPSFRVETTGYWKNLDPGQVGANRDGEPEDGRTWVTKRLTWLEGTRDQAPIRTRVPELPDGPDPGWIYVMRTAMHPPDVFKVGLTRRDPERRASELSGTGTPDRLLVVHQWPSRDCARAERDIHRRIEGSRMRENREFFEIPLRELVKVINEVLDAPNTEDD